MRLQTSETSADQAVLHVHSAERQLWCAVLGRALNDALDRAAAAPGPAERRRLRDDARAWFRANGQEFRLACEGAGYDPDRLRNRVLSLIEHGRPEAAPAA
jgi:hypothetical protein